MERHILERAELLDPAGGADYRNRTTGIGGPCNPRAAGSVGQKPSGIRAGPTSASCRAMA